MPKNIIKDIVSEAVNAPSGDNAQPWRFKIEGETLLIFNVPESDATLYNFRQRGSYLSHGALIENIHIEARARGYDMAAELFPDSENCVAHVFFSQSAVHDEPLRHCIRKRATNRKPYNKRSLEADHRTQLIDAVTEPGVRLVYVEGSSVAELARHISINERLLFENRELHDFLFGMIRWTTQEEKEKPGLYVLTMEFPAPLRFLLKYVFRHFSLVQWLNRVGLSRAIPKSSSQVYASSAAMGALIIASDTNEMFLNAGRALQRVWLTATRLTLSMQPVTALPYLAERVRANEATMFTPEHRTMILDAYAEIAKIFSLRSGEHIAMLFRTGYDGEPSARSAKHEPQYL